MSMKNGQVVAKQVPVVASSIPVGAGKEKSLGQYMGDSQWPNQAGNITPLISDFWRPSSSALQRWSVLLWGFNIGSILGLLFIFAAILLQ